MLKKALKIIAFILIAVLLFFAVQYILTPSWNSYSSCDSTIQGFFALEKNSIDVLFLGTSHTFDGVSPMRLYEVSGIRSYNLATTSQPIECSYILLKQAFESQQLKVVFLDVSKMFDDKGKDTPYYRNVMDNLYGRSAYLEFAKIYAETEDNEGFWSAAFPIIKYHTRWQKLSEADMHRSGGLYYSMGYHVRSFVGNPAPTLESLDKYNSRLLNRGSGTVVSSEGGETTSSEFANPVFNPVISDRFTEYMEKMHALCEQHGAELILMNVPALENALKGGWSTVKLEAVTEYAEEHGIELLDMHYADIVDPVTDFIDGGGHLNLSGAEAVTDYISDFLCLRKSDLPSFGTCSAQFEDAFAKYDKIRSVANLQMERDLKGYLEMLNENKEHLTVLISSRSNFAPGLQAEEIEAFRALGLDLIGNGKAYDTYLAVIRNGKVVQEALSDRRLTYTATLGGHEINMATNSSYERGSNTIEVDGVSHSMNKVGLNIVVWDNETDLPIDSLSFGTDKETHAAERTKNKIDDLLDDYEKAFLDLPEFQQKKDAALLTPVRSAFAHGRADR